MTAPNFIPSHSFTHFRFLHVLRVTSLLPLLYGSCRFLSMKPKRPFAFFSFRIHSFAIHTALLPHASGFVRLRTRCDRRPSTGPVLERLPVPSASCQQSSTAFSSHFLLFRNQRPFCFRHIPVPVYPVRSVSGICRFPHIPSVPSQCLLFRRRFFIVAERRHVF